MRLQASRLACASLSTCLVYGNYRSYIVRSVNITERSNCAVPYQNLYAPTCTLTAASDATVQRMKKKKNRHELFIAHPRRHVANSCDRQKLYPVTYGPIASIVAFTRYISCFSQRLTVCHTGCNPETIAQTSCMGGQDRLEHLESTCHSSKPT